AEIKAKEKEQKKPEGEAKEPKAEENEEKEEKEEKKAAAPKAEKKLPAKTAEAATKIEKGEEARVKASPVARRLAAELGVDLSSVKGTGPDGRVTETDVRAAAKSRSAGQKVPAPSIKAGESARI